MQTIKDKATTPTLGRFWELCPRVESGLVSLRIRRWGSMDNVPQTDRAKIEPRSS